MTNQTVNLTTPGLALAAPTLLGSLTVILNTPSLVFAAPLLSGTSTSDIYSVKGTIASSTTAVTVALLPRWAYIAVSNLGVAGTNPSIWVKTDGTVPVAPGEDNSFAVPPGQTVLVANQKPMWFQSDTVIPFGTDVPSVLTAGSPGWPGTPAMQNPLGSSAQGGVATPGTTVSVLLDTGSTSTNFAVSGNG
jgi:hypothetical protein